MDSISIEQQLRQAPVIKKALELSPDEVYLRGLATSVAREALQIALTMSYDASSYSTVRVNAEKMLSQLLA